MNRVEEHQGRVDKAWAEQDLRMDWAQLERNLRRVLSDYYREGAPTAEETVDFIDQYLAAATGRGHENPRRQVGLRRD